MGREEMLKRAIRQLNVETWPVFHEKQATFLRLIA
jgi:hypothetical protein